MKSYSTLMLDAFDTLLYINREKLFPHRFGERTINTTAPRVHEVYERSVGPVEFDRFVDAFIGSWRKTNERRETELREITSVERFRLMLEELGDPVAESDPLPELLASCHMQHLAPALDIPEGHREVLFLARRAGFRLALVSNFDYSPTLERCLAANGVRDLFDAVVISDAVGWRKPHRRIFQRAFSLLNAGPAECLFVGDRLELDVAGARGVGMDVVWVDSGAQEWTPEFDKPQYRIGALPELIPLMDQFRLPEPPAGARNDRGETT